MTASSAPASKPPRSAARMRVPAKVLRHVDPSHHARLAKHVAAGAWQAALSLPSSFRRIGLFLDLALGGFLGWKAERRRVPGDRGPLADGPRP